MRNESTRASALYHRHEMSAIQRKNLGQPDESREPPFAHTSLTQVGTHMIGRGVMEPGWRFTTHMAPLMGTTLCPIHHLQLLQSGRMGIRMADGEEIELVPGDITDIPPGHDAWVIGDEPAVVLDIAGNVSGMGLPVEHDRILTTLLMTDIVDSTKTLERLGDQRWKQLLREHDRLTRMLIDRYRGTEVDTTGDGFLARFASAVSALRCAMAIRDAVRSMGLEVRIGVHSGEVEQIGPTITGLSINATARIMALAGASQILVSSATRGLADGAGLSFRDAGSHALKGFERPIEVAELVG
jgi:class 3 adenylate cyclase